jgi:hypothetical protein
LFHTSSNHRRTNALLSVDIAHSPCPAFALPRFGAAGLRVFVRKSP